MTIGIGATWVRIYLLYKTELGVIYNAKPFITETPPKLFYYQRRRQIPKLEKITVTSLMHAYHKLIYRNANKKKESMQPIINSIQNLTYHHEHRPSSAASSCVFSAEPEPELSPALPPNNEPDSPYFNSAKGKRLASSWKQLRSSGAAISFPFPFPFISTSLSKFALSAAAAAVAAVLLLPPPNPLAPLTGPAPLAGSAPRAPPLAPLFPGCSSYSGGGSRSQALSSLSHSSPPPLPPSHAARNGAPPPGHLYLPANAPIRCESATPNTPCKPVRHPP